MSGNSVQFNRRSIISLLLAVFVVVLAATPALAHFDEVETEKNPPCWARPDETGRNSVICAKVGSQYPRPLLAKPRVVPLQIARAELMSIADEPVAQISTQ
jgi:hypothetical protein